MERDPLTAFRRTLFIRRTGWALAAVLAILGILLGAQPLTRAADLAGQALGDGARLVLDVGWLLLLLGAAGLVAGLYVSGPWGEPTARRLRWLRGRLTTRPVLVGTAAVSLLVMLVLVVVVVPPRFTANHQFKTASEELKAQSDVRTTLLQGFAALLVLTGAAIGAAVTLRQVRATREGQITDRFTKAVDQLGSEHVDVRVGGIYALERIARDSPPDRATIEEVLTAYLRDHAPWPPPPALPSLQAITQRLVTFAQEQPLALQRWTAKDTAEQTQQGRPPEAAAVEPQSPAAEVQATITMPQGPAADVQAAITVLSRRELPPDGPQPLDLTRVNLRGAQLDPSPDIRTAELEGLQIEVSEFRGAKLQGAWLEGANLQDARLDAAKLQGAWLRGANLQGAWLRGANLQGARLFEANLQGARLDAAELQGAWLKDADLQGARLYLAELQDARLFGANFRGVELLDTARLWDALADERTRWPGGWTPETAKHQGVRYPD